MCTVTFAPRKSGYVLAMNRDELLTRVAALPPKIRFLNGVRALYPSEPSGGTWIGVNENGVCLTLVNWYAITVRVQGRPVSRGEVVKAALACSTSPEVHRCLSELNLYRFNPFRLMGFFPGGQAVTEWRWDLNKLRRIRHHWAMNTWASSGFDEPGAQKTRCENFRQACRRADTGSLGWLRRLHASHQPERGAYSTCMHRSDAATVSYTEVKVTRSSTEMRYHPGSLCRLTGELAVKNLRLRSGFET